MWLKITHVHDTVVIQVMAGAPDPAFVGVVAHARSSILGLLNARRSYGMYLEPPALRCICEMIAIRSADALMSGTPLPVTMIDINGDTRSSAYLFALRLAKRYIFLHREMVTFAGAADNPVAAAFVREYCTDDYWKDPRARLKEIVVCDPGWEWAVAYVQHAGLRVVFYADAAAHPWKQCIVCNTLVLAHWKSDDWGSPDNENVLTLQAKKNVEDLVQKSQIEQLCIKGAAYSECIFINNTVRDLEIPTHLQFRGEFRRLKEILLLTFEGVHDGCFVAPPRPIVVTKRRDWWQYFASLPKMHFFDRTEIAQEAPHLLDEYDDHFIKWSPMRHAVFSDVHNALLGAFFMALNRLQTGDCLPENAERIADDIDPAMLVDVCRHTTSVDDKLALRQTRATQFSMPPIVFQ